MKKGFFINELNNRQSQIRAEEYLYERYKGFTEIYSRSLDDEIVFFEDGSYAYEGIPDITLYQTLKEIGSTLPWYKGEFADESMFDYKFLEKAVSPYEWVNSLEVNYPRLFKLKGENSQRWLEVKGIWLDKLNLIPKRILKEKVKIGIGSLTIQEVYKDIWSYYRYGCFSKGDESEEESIKLSRKAHLEAIKLTWLTFNKKYNKDDSKKISAYK